MNLALMEIFRNDICSNTIVVYDVVTMSVMSAQGSDSIALVVIVALL